MSALSNRPVVWGGVIAAFAAAAVAAYFTNMRHDAPSAPSTPAPTAAAPQAPPASGDLPVASVRTTDPGQEFYRQGRYDLAIAFWTKAAEAGDALAAHQL